MEKCTLVLNNVEIAVNLMVDIFSKVVLQDFEMSLSLEYNYSLKWSCNCAYS